MANKRKLRENENERIAKKIKKLEQKLKQRRRIIASDSESELESQVLSTPSPPSSPSALPIDQGEVFLDMPGMISPIPETSPCAHANEDSTYVEQVNADLNNPKPGTSTAEISTKNDTCNQEHENELDDSILQILGEAPQPEMALGQNIHKDISTRWQDILLKGLSKELKDSILKKYLIPANCNFLIAPILNPEAKAAVPDIIAKRDNTLLQKQNQIGFALAALSKLTEMIIKNETSKQILLQPLSDACRILCDSHNMETKTRRSIITSSINTSVRDALTNTARDKYLFGEDLPEKLKIAKSVQKTGETLEKSNPMPSSSKISNFRQVPKNRNLNFRGTIHRRPPNRPSESSRGRAPVRQPRTATSTFTRPPPPPPRASPPTRKTYRR